MPQTFVDEGLSPKPLLLLLLGRAPRAQEGGPSERQHILGAGREEGYQRCAAGGHRELLLL